MVNVSKQPQASLEELSLLKEFLDSLPLKYRTIVAIAYLTSSRIRDVLTLKVSDIKANLITINQSELSQGKCSPILPLLQSYLTVYLNGKKFNQSEFLFADKFGQPLKTSTVFKVLQLVAKPINFPDVYLFVL